MGLASEIISGNVTNPGATITALTPATGDAFTVKNFQFEQGAFLENAWTQQGTAGVLRIRSPRMHDQAQGIRLQGLANDPEPRLPEQANQVIYPQDALTVEMSGGAAETDVAALQMYYRDLPGIAARLVMWEDIASRVVNIIGNQSGFTSSATAGQWGPGEAISADFDTLKANVDYAVLGYMVTTAVCAVTLRGPDTGNLRVGGPGTVEVQETRDWFIRQSRQTGLPHIPVLNAANRAGTLLDVVASTASVATTVTLVLGELRAV